MNRWIYSAKRSNVACVGNVTSKSCVDDDIHEVNLSDVYFVPSLSKDLRLISYNQLKKRGCRWVDDNKGGKIIQGSRTVFDFKIVNDVCMVETVDYLRKDMKSKSLIDIVLPEVAKSSDFSVPHRGTLVQFHQRLGHLSYDSMTVPNVSHARKARAPGPSSPKRIPVKIL